LFAGVDTFVPTTLGLADTDVDLTTLSNRFTAAAEAWTEMVVAGRGSRPPAVAITS
jgi:hypothetical protein